MEVIKKIWDFFNGKKSVIGGVCLWIGVSFIGDLLIGELGLTAAILPKIAAVFTWLGTYLTPVGLAHKGLKAIGTK